MGCLMANKKETYFLVYRGWAGHQAFKKEPYTQREAFLWIVENAAFAPLDVSSKVTGGTISLKRGELSYALEYMATAWQWKTKARVKRFLKRLEKWNIIVHKTIQGQSHVTVCNYSKYQDGKSKSDTEVSTKGSTKVSTKTDTNNKELLRKNEKQLVKELPDFISLNSLEEFIDHRKDIKKPMSKKAISLFIGKLSKLHQSGYDPSLLIEGAILNGWQSVYEKDEYRYEVKKTSIPVDQDLAKLWDEKNELHTMSNFVRSQIEYLDTKQDRTQEDEERLNELATEWSGIEKRKEELQDYMSELQRQ